MTLHFKMPRICPLNFWR